MKYLCFFILGLLISFITQGQSTINPIVANSNRKNCKITRVDIQGSKTLVTLEITETRGTLGGRWVSISSSTYLSNFNNSTESFKILSLGDRELDKHYSTIKGEKYIFTLIFPKLPSGIEKINIKEIIPEGGGFEWNEISIDNPVFNTKTELKVSQTNNSLNFNAFLSGVKYAYISQSNDFIKKIEENPNNAGAYIISGLISYLKDIGFAEVIFGSTKTRNYPSECEVVVVVPFWTFENNTFTKIKLSFYSCNNDRFLFESSDNIEVNNLDNLAIDFHNAFMKMHGNKKPTFLLENRLTLPSEMTDWTEVKLKTYFSENGADQIEGIYENTVQKVNDSKYKLGLIKIDNNYILIYIGGANNYLDWKEGEIKAKLSETATFNLFKADWKLNNKELNQNFYISFESGLMNLLAQDKEKAVYLKLFPTSEDNASGSNTKPSSGTGFAISSNGFIVTNHHVVNGAKSIKIRGVNGDFSTTLNAKLLVTDKNNDLAIIKIDDTKFKTLGIIPFLISSKTADVGSSIFVMGYPLRGSMGDEIKLTNGIVSSKSGFQGDVTSYQISAPVQPGNSGGPLFDSQGNLIGIINAKHLGAENVSYAVKANYLLNLIDLLDNPPSPQNVSSLSGKPLTQQVEIAKRFVYIIEVK